MSARPVPGLDTPQILNMPASPWIDLDPDAAYAWAVSLAGAIACARGGITTILKDPDGIEAARIGPPGTCGAEPRTRQETGP